MSKALSIEELICHLRELAADEHYVPPMKKIVDFTDLEDAPMPAYSMDDFVRLGSFYENELGGEHCVFVTPSDFSFGMARLFEAYMSDADIKVKVVRTLENALELLGIAEKEFREGQRVKRIVNAKL
ncbi:MAG: hypothetical protein KQH53_13730 [Desulfarculaceae bacterium]|nr:hypothetical protein [Desulfarculaceae bacterium]